MLGRHAIFATAAALVLLAPAVWAWLRSADSAPPAASAAAPALPAAEPESAREIRSLRRSLEEARQQIRELSAEAEWLRQLVVGFASSPPGRGEDAAGGGPAEAEGEESNGKGVQERRFDEAALAAAGVAPSEIEHLRRVYDAHVLHLLEVKHRAVREGWFRKPRHRQEVWSAHRALVEEVGEEGWDLILYATGNDNRVVVQELLQDAPAERYGFEPGDVILSYGGHRVFKRRKLKFLTTLGERGERVAVEVVRDGEPIRLYAERGPLGLTLDATRQVPQLR